MRLFFVVYRTLLLVLFLLSYSSATAQLHPDDVYWADQFGLPGVSGGITDGLNPPNTVVKALATHGDIVFVGGDFTLPSSFIAAWNTSLGQWESLGDGVDGVVSSLLVVGDDLYVGGKFSRVGNVFTRGIARWNIPTGTWSAVGGGIQGDVQCLESDGTYLYAAGWFSIAGAVGANNIARWNGSQWEPLGSGGRNGVNGSYINDLAIYQGKLYVGLTYGFAGVDTNNRYLAVWDGSAWSSTAKFRANYLTGSEPAVHALAVYNGTLVVGGDFDSVGTVPASGLVQWDGSQWQALGDIKGAVKTLCISGDNLYVGGVFDQVAQILANNIAIRDMSTGKWSTAGSGTGPQLYSGNVLAATRLGSDIYIGGNFRVAGSLTVNYIARWKPQSKEWAPLTSQTSAGMSGGSKGVYAFAPYRGELAAAGDFLLAGNVLANGVAMWNGQQWRAASGGLNNPQISALHAVAAHGDNLYVGGGFNGIGSSSAAYLARYDGAAWYAIGTPDGSRASNKWPKPWPEIYAVYHDGNRLYAGGEFTVVGGASANCIAEWDGQQWRGLGSGVQNKDMYVYAITKDYAGTLYAGGDFDVMGGVATGGIARWNGSSWSELGGSLQGTVLALATDGTDLYAAGSFVQAGGRFVNNIARWDGSAWHDLHGGTESSGAFVLALAVHNGKLYAGGRFSTMGGVITRNIAVWDIQSGQWEALGSGVDNTVRALAVHNGDLYVGGSFQRAGDKVSGSIARWTKQAATAVDEGRKNKSEQLQSFPNPASETTVFSFSVACATSVTVVLRDILGREVARPFEGALPAGHHAIPCSVALLPAGVYTAVVTCGDACQSLRVVVVR